MSLDQVNQLQVQIVSLRKAIGEIREHGGHRVRRVASREILRKHTLKFDQIFFDHQRKHQGPWL